jgi:coproporphyrinogen III oxidase-like Fe-S oxidoreductase
MPYLITPKMVYILKKYNVNRVNYAVQCFNEEVLKNNNRYLTLNFDHRNMVSQIEKS